TLPDYMVPAAYVRLDAMPLTPNGKLNRDALPAPDGAAYASRGYVAPEGEVEQTIADIWADILRIDQVGRHDNFFELGGHSLMAIRAVNRLASVYPVNLSLRSLFERPTLGDQAAYIEARLATSLGEPHDYVEIDI
ncbi:phosphopantetheine-binding protein, partial [Agrobacterium cavarae]